MRSRISPTQFESGLGSYQRRRKAPENLRTSLQQWADVQRFELGMRGHPSMTGLKTARIAHQALLALMEN